MRYYQSHKEKIIPQMKLHLTIMPVNFTCLFLAVKSLYLYEKKLKAINIHILLCSLQVTAWKMLGRILKALTTSNNHSVSCLSYIKIQQARRDMTLSASKSLSDMAKKQTQINTFLFWYLACRLHSTRVTYKKQNFWEIWFLIPLCLLSPEPAFNFSENQIWYKKPPS